MKPFSVLFEEAGSNVIDYNGRKVFLCLKCTRGGKYVIKLRNSRVNSVDRQIIGITTNFVGSITINGEKIKKKKGRFSSITIPEEYIKEEMLIEIELKEGRFAIYNGSVQNDSEYTRSMVFGCAMNPVKVEDGWFVLNCNDYEIDDDFDDLIFEMNVESDSHTVDIIEEWQPVCAKSRK